MVQTKATVKFATAATPTVHQARTKAGKTGMTEVRRPLRRVSREKRRMDLRTPMNVTPTTLTPPFPAPDIRDNAG